MFSFCIQVSFGRSFCPKTFSFFFSRFRLGEVRMHCSSLHCPCSLKGTYINERNKHNILAQQLPDNLVHKLLTKLLSDNALVSYPIVFGHFSFWSCDITLWRRVLTVVCVFIIVQPNIWHDCHIGNCKSDQINNVEASVGHLKQNCLKCSSSSIMIATYFL